METGTRELKAPFFRNAKVGHSRGWGGPLPEKTGEYETVRWGDLQEFLRGTIKVGDRLGGDVCVLSKHVFGDASWPSSHEVLMVPAIYTVRADVQAFMKKYSAEEEPCPK